MFDSDSSRKMMHARNSFIFTSLVPQVIVKYNDFNGQENSLFMRSYTIYSFTTNYLNVTLITTLAHKNDVLISKISEDGDNSEENPNKRTI